MADEIKLTAAQRLSLVRKLWMLHPIRGETAALNFYEEMEEDHPELLRRGTSGDDYQRLRGDIADLIDQPPSPAEPAN
jgi:hypothetical protein